MKKFWWILIMIAVLGLIGIVSSYLFFHSDNWSSRSCADECKHRGLNFGECQWPTLAFDNYVNIGPCLDKFLSTKSEHCGNEGQCNCYCYNEQLIGGCAGVALEYRQICCDNWARENEIVHVACAGEWTINDENLCEWMCEGG